MKTLYSLLFALALAVPGYAHSECGSKKGTCGKNKCTCESECKGCEDGECKCENCKCEKCKDKH